MADKISKNQLGLTLGIFAALCHLIWSIAVAIGIKSYLNWILLLHSIKLDILLTNVVILNVIILLILAFVGGYIVGYIFAALYSYIGKKVK